MIGKFIVLDGNDGSGKATQAKLLAEALEKKGVSVERIEFPAYDRNVFGALIGECLAGERGDFVHLDPKIASSLYALDRFESAASIRTALAEGKTVTADRYASSNQIHQGGKIEDESERHAFMQWLDRVEHEVLGIPRPDMIVYLRVPLEVSLGLLEEKRALKNSALAVGEMDTVEADRTYLARSIETAEWLLASQPNWRVVDCMQEGGLRSREEIHQDICDILEAS